MPSVLQKAGQNITKHVSEIPGRVLRLRYLEHIARGPNRKYSRARCTSPPLLKFYANKTKVYTCVGDDWGEPCNQTMVVLEYHPGDIGPASFGGCINAYDHTLVQNLFQMLTYYFTDPQVQHLTM